MSTSPIASGSLITYTVKVSGATIKDTFQVHAVLVEKFVNRIASATITLLDGSASQESFSASASDTFVPGNKIAIEAGYDNKNSVIFEGVITKQTIRVDAELGSGLEVECKDEAIQMTIGRKSASYNNVTDSEVISQLIGNYSDLSADVSATSAQLPELLQYYTSDWDFMLTRAEVNAQIVTTINGKVATFAPDKNSSPVLTITYGDNMYHLNAEMNAVTQLSQVKASAWDYKTQQVISQTANNNDAGPGNISSKTLSSVVGPSEFDLQTSAAIESDNLSNWAKGQMIKSEFNKITGEVRFQGSELVEPGVYITIAGCGGRFDGNHLVSGVTHDISEGNWFTVAELGLSANWFANEPSVMAPPAAGLLPGVQGLYNATVKKIYDDPDNQYRILLDMPLFDPKGEGVWARLTNFYSSSGFGAFFLPEVGDEVVVGFLNDDPRYPIILGSLYSSGRKPYSQCTPNEDNSPKAIVTKSELRILFDDKEKVMTLQTPAGNKVLLDDQNKQIKIEDQNSNAITMSESGIAIKSPKTVSISADEKVTVSGETGVTVSASGGDVKVSGVNIKATADMQYSAEGSMTASVQGGTELTLKAAMVMIN